MAISTQHWELLSVRRRTAAARRARLQPRTRRRAGTRVLQSVSAKRMACAANLGKAT